MPTRIVANRTMERQLLFDIMMTVFSETPDTVRIVQAALRREP